MENRLSFPRALFTGLYAGLAGALFFMPVNIILRHLLWWRFEEYPERGTFLYNLVVGYPLNVEFFIAMPIAGMLLGMLGAYIGYLRNSPHIRRWGLLAGALINIFFGFWEAI